MQDARCIVWWILTIIDSYVTLNQINHSALPHPCRHLLPLSISHHHLWCWSLETATVGSICTSYFSLFFSAMEVESHNGNSCASSQRSLASLVQIAVKFICFIPQSVLFHFREVSCCVQRPTGVAYPVTCLQAATLLPTFLLTNLPGTFWWTYIHFFLD